MTFFFYILKDYLKYVLGTVTLTVFLFVLFDFIGKSSREFAEYAPSAANIWRFYLLQIPGQIVQALPIAGLLGSVIAMILLSRTNEITAMRSVGMGPLQIGAPLAFGGLTMSVLSLVLGEYWIPSLAQKVHYVHEVQMRREKDDQLAGDARWLRQGQTLINFQDFDPATSTLSHVKMIEVRPNFRPIQSTEADSATYAADTKTWYLRGIKVLHFKRNGTLDHLDYADTLAVPLPIEPKKLKRDRRNANELSIAELSEKVERGEQQGMDTIKYKVELHGKLAYPFAAFVVSLIGLKFGYKSERATETTKGVLIAFFIGISYWFIMSAGRALGLRGTIPPMVSAWMANLVILGIISFDAWMSRKL